MARKPKPITCRHCGKPLTVQTAGKRIKEATGIWYYCDEACNLAYFGLATLPTPSPEPEEVAPDESG